MRIESDTRAVREVCVDPSYQKPTQPDASGKQELVDTPGRCMLCGDPLGFTEDFGGFCTAECATIDDQMMWKNPRKSWSK
jgi:hypothetical protein